MLSLKDRLAGALNGLHEASQRNDAACLLALNDYVESLLNEVAVLESRQTDAAVKDGH